MSELKKDYYKIDPDIKNLVSIMNILGFKTYASCQGHCWPVDKLKPYFAFTCEMDNAKLFDMILREDEYSMNPKLNWVWTLNACFNSKFELTWQLRPGYSHKAHSKYFRSCYIKDFDIIYKLLRLNFDKGYQTKHTIQKKEN